MLAAFFIVGAYLGFVGIGSQFMDAPPKPRDASIAPEAQRSSVSIATTSGDEGTARSAEH